jgi:hypothetical protein
MFRGAPPKPTKSWKLVETTVGGLAKVPGSETVKTLVSIAVCYSFNEELKCRTCTQYAILPTGNLRAVQLLLGHTKFESTVRYLGIEVDDALAITKQVDV